MDQSEHRTSWPQGQRLRPRIVRKYIRVLTRLTSVGNTACTFDIVTRPENWPTANLRHVSATCAQYGVGPTLVGMLLKNQSGDPQITHIRYPRRSCRRSRMLSRVPQRSSPLIRSIDAITTFCSFWGNGARMPEQRPLSAVTWAPASTAEALFFDHEHFSGPIQGA